MADDVKKKETARQINEKDRFRYIGFEVFPGKPKDLFKSDAEKEKLIDIRRKKRESGDLIREECTLFDDRVSLVDRAVLTLASLVIVATLFIPWFSVYNEIEKTAAAPQAVTDTLAIAGGEVAGDSLALAAGAAVATADSAVAAVTGQVAEAPAVPVTEEVAANEEAAGGAEVATEETTPNEEVLHGYVAKKQFYKEYERVSGLGVFLALGSVAPVAFSSGLALALISILAIAMILVCLAFPVYTLYILYGAKGSSDARALQLKKTLRLGWIPLMIFVGIIFLSFFTGEYSSPVGQAYGSLGDGFNIGVLLDTMSWGLVISLASSILAAAKGIEI